MIDLPYSLVIEATDEPDYFGFYSAELEGFSGAGLRRRLYIQGEVRDEGAHRFVGRTGPRDPSHKPGPENRYSKRKETGGCLTGQTLHYMRRQAQQRSLAIDLFNNSLDTLDKFFLRNTGSAYPLHVGCSFFRFHIHNH